MKTTIDAAYLSRPQDKIQILGELYTPPAQFEHMRPVIVAEFGGTEELPRRVQILESRAPARFFQIVASNFGGERAFVLEFGTVDPELVGRIALELAGNMMGRASKMWKVGLTREDVRAAVAVFQGEAPRSDDTMNRQLVASLRVYFDRVEFDGRSIDQAVECLRRAGYEIAD